MPPEAIGIMFVTLECMNFVRPTSIVHIGLLIPGRNLLPESTAQSYLCLSKH